MDKSHGFLEDVAPAERALDPASYAAATNGVAIDMRGYEAVRFVLAIGAGAFTKDAKVQRDDNSGFSSATDITGAAIVQVAAGGVNQAFVIDVVEPKERYVRLVFTPGGAVIAGAVAEKYAKAGQLPPTALATQSVKVYEGTP